MPEGPEVYYLTEYICRNFRNKRLKNITIHKGRYKIHGPPEHFNEFKNSLSLSLKNVYKKGKVIVLCFEDDWYMIVKLGIAGWFFTREEKPEIMNSENIIFEFENKELIFSDFISFGTLAFTHNPNDVIAEMEKLAPDIMSSRFTMIAKKIDAYRGNSKIQNMYIEDALIQQTLFFSGVGNIIKSEALYDSKISPTTKVKDLSIEQWNALFASCKKITNKILRHLSEKGFDIDGYYKLHQVYRKTHDKYGNKVHVRNTKDNRKTYWVPEIQDTR